MERVELLLAESDLSALAFTIIERFSTHRSVQAVLAELMNVVGASLQLWARADHVTHVFVNPRFGAAGQCHRLACSPERSFPSSSACAYEELDARPPVPKFAPFEPLASYQVETFDLASDHENDLLRVALPAETFNQRSGVVRLARFDFVNTAPLGFFVAAWTAHAPPADRDLALIQNALWNIARVVSTLICNQYTVHANTYMPAYQLEGDKTATILFADIRNSTTLFEVARVARAEAVVECLLRAWFRYAADLIARSGLGNLHRFTGDGLLSTFGEYAIGTESIASDEIACVLGLHAARQLLDAFACLYDRWRSSAPAVRFLRDTNEDVEVNLGVGLDCGTVRFAYIGRSLFGDGDGPAPTRPGDAPHLEYCAFGDHMNTASRLADLAMKPHHEAAIGHRGPRAASDYRLAPIVVSHRVANRLGRVLGDSPRWFEERRGLARLRGKGLGQAFYEIDAKDVDRARCAQHLTDVADGIFTRLINSPPLPSHQAEGMMRELNVLNG